MFGEAAGWPFQVEIKLPRARFEHKLRAIEHWLHDWEIPYRVGSTLGDVGVLRVRFTEQKFARAFQMTHGGTLIADYGIDAAMQADLEDEAEYLRLKDL